MERRVVLAFVLGLVIMGVPFAVQGYTLSKQLSRLENQIGLIDQELDELWEEINALKEGTMNFTFTWGPDTQRIVRGTFRLEISFRLEDENMSMIVKANDDEYNEEDYIGLVFDKNNNGVIDLGHADEPYGLWANNMTTASVLVEHGFLGFAELIPKPGPQKCTFDPDTGYLFEIQFPYLFYDTEWNPAHALKKGDHNPLHICFYDYDAPYPTMGVFVRFLFYVPESA